MKIPAFCFTSIGSVLFLLVPRVLAAQPTVIIRAKPLNQFHSVLITFVQDDLPSMMGCHYNLFAADKARDLRTLPGKGLSIATFYRALPEVQIIAEPLPHIASNFGRHGKVHIVPHVKVYLRTLLSCPSATNGLGKIISFNVRTYTRGGIHSVDQFDIAMKYHMQYYQSP